MSELWNESQVKVIALYQEKLGMTRSNAVRKMRGLELRKITPDQQVENLTKELADRKSPAKVREKHDVGSNPVKVVEKKATPAEPKKERKSAVPYEKRHAAGLCVKCPRPAPKEGTVCAYCRAMATYFNECKADKREFTRENFARTNAAQEAEKLAAKGEVPVKAKAERKSAEKK
jgi:hypothetical protein